MIDTIRTRQLEGVGVKGEVMDDGAGQVLVRMSTYQFDQYIAYVRNSHRHVSDSGDVTTRERDWWET